MIKDQKKTQETEGLDKKVYLKKTSLKQVQQDLHEFLEGFEHKLSAPSLDLKLFFAIYDAQVTYIKTFTSEMQLFLEFLQHQQGSLNELENQKHYSIQRIIKRAFELELYLRDMVSSLSRDDEVLFKHDVIIYQARITYNIAYFKHSLSELDSELNNLKHLHRVTGHHNSFEFSIGQVLALFKRNRLLINSIALASVIDISLFFESVQTLLNINTLSPWAIAIIQLSVIVAVYYFYQSQSLNNQKITDEFELCLGLSPEPR